MGKPDGGGSRPIALMVMFYRLWTKIRKPELTEWERMHAGVWDAARTGSSALRAAVLSLFQDELHVLLGDEATAILWGMEKFYDNIKLHKLTPEIRLCFYPIRIGFLGLLMHMAPRVLRGYNHHVICRLPTNAIIAGCTQSKYFAKVLIYQVIKCHLER